MAFRTNSYRQLSFTDSSGGLTSREQKALEHSWAKVFADDSSKYPKTQPHRTAVYLCSKTGYLSSQKPLRQPDQRHGTLLGLK